MPQFISITPWQAPEPLFPAVGVRLSPQVQNALAHSGSLTRFIENQFRQPVTVQLEKQWLAPDWDDGFAPWGAARPPGPGPLFCRHAWLKAGSEMIVYAYSQVMVARLSPRVRAEIERGEQPIGALFLSEERSVVREQLEVARVEVVGVQGLTDGEAYWCRRSWLVVDGGVHGRIFELFTPAWQAVPSWE